MQGDDTGLDEFEAVEEADHRRVVAQRHGHPVPGVDLGDLREGLRIQIAGGVGDAQVGTGAKASIYARTMS